MVEQTSCFAVLRGTPQAFVLSARSLPTMPRLVTPLSKIFRAAFISLSCSEEQTGHYHCSTPKTTFGFIYPQVWQVLDVFFAETFTKVVLYAIISLSIPNPWSETAFP